MAIDVTNDNFQDTVIQASETTPVLLDFWADWCAPCKILTPILEKVEKKFEQRFILAKLNTQKFQQIAARFQVSGIPNCKLFIKQKVVDEFTGALPENKIIEFLEKHLPDPKLKNVELLIKNSRYEEAGEMILKEKITGKSAFASLWTIIVSLLENISSDHIDKILSYVEYIPDYGVNESDKKNVLLASLVNHKNNEIVWKNISTLARNRQSNSQELHATLNYFLEILENSTVEHKKDNKNWLILCFHILGNEHPLTAEYRRKMSSLLY